MFHDHLDVCLLRQGGRLAMLRFALNLLLKRPLREPLVDFFTLSAAQLQGTAVSMQIDGDVGAPLPAKIEAVPQAVRMILPATYNGGARAIENI